MNVEFREWERLEAGGRKKEDTEKNNLTGWTEWTEWTGWTGLHKDADGGDLRRYDAHS